jgi:hypothetical protein
MKADREEMMGATQLIATHSFDDGSFMDAGFCCVHAIGIVHVHRKNSVHRHNAPRMTLG